MSKGESKPLPGSGKHSSDPILLTGWPDSAVVAVEAVLKDFWPAAISGDREHPGLNPFRERLQRLTFSAGMEELEQAVALNDSSVVILCLPDIEHFMADALDRESSPSDSPGQWLNALSATLRFQERDPERALVVIAEDTVRLPDMFALALSEHVGYQLSFEGGSQSAAVDRWVKLYQHLARLHVSGDKELSEASAELRTRCLFDTPPQSDAGAQWVTVCHEIETLRQENGLLVGLAHRLQSQLEENVLQSGKDSEQIAALQQKCDQIEVDLADQKEALQRMRSSTSWRVTRPLRKAVTLMRRPSHRG